MTDPAQPTPAPTPQQVRQRWVDAIERAFGTAPREILKKLSVPDGQDLVGHMIERLTDEELIPGPLDGVDISKML
ncbi:hypothetical protein [Lichenibacterium dinghuense]|uniref:hypothetical protein n=1 Tax=Lichenibacterium dinghuense TaxID=2895977 RepID=UPI001F35DB20|nr:hypothetical protein [Lichenibacterium sp. 6Y81]